MRNSAAETAPNNSPEQQGRDKMQRHLCSTGRCFVCLKEVNGKVLAPC